MKSPRRGGSEGDILLGEGSVFSSTANPRSQQAKPTSRQAKWRARNPLAAWAHAAFQSALKRGLISRQPCELCGDERTDAHHDNYDRPLTVRFLCRRHHKLAHKEASAMASSFLTGSSSAGQLWACIDPDSLCTTPHIAERRFGAYLAPFLDEADARQALFEAGASEIAPEGPRKRRG